MFLKSKKSVATLMSTIMLYNLSICESSARSIFTRGINYKETWLDSEQEIEKHCDSVFNLYYNGKSLKESTDEKAKSLWYQNFVSTFIPEIKYNDFYYLNNEQVRKKQQDLLLDIYYSMIHKYDIPADNTKGIPIAIDRMIEFCNKTLKYHFLNENTDLNYTFSTKKESCHFAPNALFPAYSKADEGLLESGEKISVKKKRNHGIWYSDGVKMPPITTGTEIFHIFDKEFDFDSKRRVWRISSLWDGHSSGYYPTGLNLDIRYNTLVHQSIDDKDILSRSFQEREYLEKLRGEGEFSAFNAHTLAIADHHVENDEYNGQVVPLKCYAPKKHINQEKKNKLLKMFDGKKYVCLFDIQYIPKSSILQEIVKEKNNYEIIKQIDYYQYKIGTPYEKPLHYKKVERFSPPYVLSPKKLNENEKIQGFIPKINMISTILQENSKGELKEYLLLLPNLECFEDNINEYEYRLIEGVSIYTKPLEQEYYLDNEVPVYIKPPINSN